MTLEDKKAAILKTLTIQNGLFDNAKCPAGEHDFQFTFNEPEGVLVFRLSVRDRMSSVVEGGSALATSEIVTDLRTLEAISGGYTTPRAAMRERRLAAKGNVRLFRRVYAGTRAWELPAGLFKETPEIAAIKRVLILNCSPRGKMGATAAMLEPLASGMARAGAQVTTLFPASMSIRPCIGCFNCWVSESRRCIYDKKDEMHVILEHYWQDDLIVWATPIYHYHGTTAMKTVMDRLFVNADPHMIKVDGCYRHPRKVQHLPYYAVLAVGGFPAMDIFGPLRSTFQALAAHTGIRLIGELYRHTSMPFTMTDLRIKKKDEVLKAFDDAGFELVSLQKITRRTKRLAEQDVAPVQKLMATVNSMMDIMQRGGEVPFRRRPSARVDE